MKSIKMIAFFCLLMIGAITAQDKSDITMTNVSQINTPALEFSPAFYHHGVVFVSSQFRHGKRDASIGENTFELLYADLGPKGRLSKPAPLSLKINTQFHEGPVTFSRDNKYMYFTRNNLKNGEPVRDKKGVIRLKIYRATKGLSDWENIKELSFNNDEYTCMHPTLSADGNRMYFASDRKGGFGGMDLYYSDWKNGYWDAPVNLGPEVNSNFSEAFPFVHPSGKLFFASNRPGGLGNMDIYMVDTKSPDKLEVETLPAPINSAEDDLSFIISNTGITAFLASSRAGGSGKDDIYRASIPGGLEGLFPKKKSDLIVSVRNKATQELISESKLNVVELPEGKSIYSLNEIFGYTMRNIEEGEVVVRHLVKEDFPESDHTYMTDKTGAKKITVLKNRTYIIAAAKKGFKANFVKVNTFANENKVEIFLTPIPVAVVELPAPPALILEVGTVVVLDQIFYDFDKSYIRTDASRGLETILELMERFPAMEIELTAHTDSRGEKAYNQKLSLQRAISAKYFLTSRGIAENRIVALGKGETALRNQCKDGVKCSEADHQFNRRTEIKITSLGAKDRVEYKNNLPDYIDIPKKRKKD